MQTYGPAFEPTNLYKNARHDGALHNCNPGASREETSCLLALISPASQAYVMNFKPMKHHILKKQGGQLFLTCTENTRKCHYLWFCVLPGIKQDFIHARQAF